MKLALASALPEDQDPVMTVASDQPITPARSLLKPDKVEALSLLVLLVVVGYRLFVTPAMGMADNGDFSRFMERAGLEHVSTEYADKYFLYVNAKYHVRSPATFDNEYK